MRSEIEMHHYQDRIVDFCHEKSAAAIWVDMGLGKTVSLWTVIRDTLAGGEIKRWLIVAPVKVATQTWPNEGRSWDHLAGIPYTVIRHEDALVRQQLVRSRARVHIINREMLVWLINYCAKEKVWPYDGLVIDESSSFKDHRTARFKAMRQVLPKFKRIYTLTATPATESYIGLFSQFFLLDRGQRFGVSVERFRDRYFTYNQYTRKYKLREGAEEEIAAKIADITIVMKAEDYLNLEQPHMLERRLRLTAEEMRLYRDFENDLILKLPNGKEIEALTGSALAQKLCQAASGTVYETLKKAMEDGRVLTEKIPHNFHDHKLGDVEEVAEELEGSPLMIAYWWQSSRDRLKALFPKAVVMDKEGKAVDRWNAGKIPTLLIHPASAGHGLNMQYGPGRDIYFFDIPWSGEMYWQLIRRLARQGQKKVVRVHHPIVEGTADEDIITAQREKADVQEALFRRIRKIRGEVARRRAA